MCYLIINKLKKLTVWVNIKKKNSEKKKILRKKIFSISVTSLFQSANVKNILILCKLKLEGSKAKKE